MTARTSYADLGWRPDCENEPDHDDFGEEDPGPMDVDVDPDLNYLPDEEDLGGDEAVPVRIDDDHPDLNDLPDPWADSPGWDDNSKGS